MTQEFLVSIGRYANRNSVVSHYFLPERRRRKTGKNGSKRIYQPPQRPSRRCFYAEKNMNTNMNNIT